MVAMARIDALVIGAGLVGLAIARHLARLGLETVLVGAKKTYGSGTSSRNSEVIHAGIYYPAGSLKAELCFRGRNLLYKYCAFRGIPHRKLGKLIFAKDRSQLGALATILATARQAGVDDLEELSGDAVRQIEPELACDCALLCPSTGILDSRTYMAALLGHAEDAGAIFARSTTVTRIEWSTDNAWRIYQEGEKDPVVHARIAVNAGGLHAHHLAARTEGMDPSHIPLVRYARGVYFTYSGPVPFNRLIYPVPVAGGLGTHLTLDIGSAARFGPDVEWVDEIDCHVDPARHAAFVAAARLIWPSLDAQCLVPGFAGIRPKLSGPGEPAADFRIDGPEIHKQRGLVNLFGIESLGLTASLAIAEHVIACFVARTTSAQQRPEPLSTATQWRMTACVY